MWNHDTENNILIFLSKNFEFKENVAIFSFGRTLLRDYMSNKPWQLYNNSVIDFLLKLREGSIIVIENEFKIPIEEIKEVTEFFLNKINSNDISFMFIFVLAPNMYKKPNTNIIKKLEEIYEKTISVDHSIIIGGNAGRITEGLYNSDIDDIDRAFAYNNKINTFRTPEQIFADDITPRKWAWRGPKINDIMDKQVSLIEPKFDHYYEDERCITFISGPPASGKTILSKRIYSYLTSKNENGSIIFDANSSSRENIVKDFNNLVKAHNSKFGSLNINVIIVDTINDIKQREYYFNGIKKILPHIKILYWEIETNIEVCTFLNKFKLQITKNPNIIEYPQYIFKKYFTAVNKIGPPHMNNLRYIKFPLILRSRAELYYKY